MRTKRFAVAVLPLRRHAPAHAVGWTPQPPARPFRDRRRRQLSKACRAPSHTEFTARLGVVLDESDESELWVEVANERAWGDQMYESAVGRERRVACDLLRGVPTARADDRRSRHTLLCLSPFPAFCLTFLQSCHPAILQFQRSPHRNCSTLMAATGTASALRVRWPSVTSRSPRARAACHSVSVHPPSGPIDDRRRRRNRQASKHGQRVDLGRRAGLHKHQGRRRPMAPPASSRA